LAAAAAVLMLTLAVQFQMGNLAVLVAVVAVTILQQLETVVLVHLDKVMQVVRGDCPPHPITLVAVAVQVVLEPILLQVIQVEALVESVFLRQFQALLFFMGVGVAVHLMVALQELLVV
jgi:hypothetical protein